MSIYNQRVPGLSINFLKWILSFSGIGIYLFSKIISPKSNLEEERSVHAKERVQINQQTERLIENYGNSILRIAYTYMHNLADAEDILQDTLIQYLRTSPTFRDNEHEKAWLLRVSINLSKNKIKSNKRRETMQLDEGIVSKEESELHFVWAAVKQLPQMYAEVLHLFYHEGYSTEQIASVLEKKESTVRSLLHRAREKLKFVLKEDYDFAE